MLWPQPPLLSVCLVKTVYLLFDHSNSCLEKNKIGFYLDYFCCLECKETVCWVSLFLHKLLQSMLIWPLSFQNWRCSFCCWTPFFQKTEWMIGLSVPGFDLQGFLIHLNAVLISLSNTQLMLTSASAAVNSSRDFIIDCCWENLWVGCSRYPTVNTTVLFSFIP